MRNKILSFLLVSFFSLTLAHKVAFAQFSACNPGDTMQSNTCTVENAPAFIMKAIKVGTFTIGIITILGFVGISLKDLVSTGGGPQFYLGVKKRLGFLVVGVALIFFTTFMASILRGLGVPGSYLEGIDLFSLLPVQHAYAESAPSIIPGTIMDVVYALISMFWKWVLFPGVIATWVYAGFLYVDAQGNPEKIAKAHKMLLGTVIVTGFLIFGWGFIMAAKSSAPVV